MQIHCTKKLLDALDLSPRDLTSTPDANPLFSWHANLVHIMRRKTIIFVNDEIFYVLLLTDMRKARFDNFITESMTGLRQAILSENLGAHYADFLIGDHVTLHKTYSRKILGVMNDALRHVRFHVEQAGGWDQIDRTELIKEINRTPWLCGIPKGIFAIEKLEEVLKTVFH